MRRGKAGSGGIVTHTPAQNRLQTRSSGAGTAFQTMTLVLSRSSRIPPCTQQSQIYTWQLLNRCLCMWIRLLWLTVVQVVPNLSKLNQQQGRQVQQQVQCSLRGMAQGHTSRAAPLQHEGQHAAVQKKDLSSLPAAVIKHT
jgi:hypothetical protein